MAVTAPGTMAPTPTIDRARWRAFFASAVGWACDGFETFALVLAGPIALGQLLAPDQRPRLSIYFGGLLAATLFGWATGGIIAGVLSDYLGRRRTLMISILWYALFAGLTAFSQAYWMLLVARFMTGVGLGGEWGPGTAMIGEYWPPAKRGQAAGWLQSSFGFGFLIASGLWLVINPLGAASWRYMFLIGVLPALLVLYFRTGVRDPEMWRHADEQRTAAKLRAAQQHELAPEERALTRFTLAYVATAPEFRRRLILLLLMSLASVLGWWTTSSWVPQYAAQLAGKASLNPQQWASLTGLTYNVGGIAGYILLGVFADVWGRKPAAWCFFSGALVMDFVLFLGVHTSGTLLWVAAINGFFTAGQFSWMAIYLPELFPTAVRGSAISLVFNLSRYIAAFGPLLAGVLIASLGGISTAAALFGLIYILGIVVTPFVGPETKGKPLPA